jgi:uncharacterized membrane protein YhaH (DUF805 family)
VIDLGKTPEQAPDAPGAAPQDDLHAATPQTYLPKLLQLNGRIGRVRYLAYGLAMNLVLVLCLFVVALLGGGVGDGSVTELLYGVAALAMAVVLGRRRFHDLGRSGWFTLLLLVPVVNLFVSLWLIFVRGNDGANRFGPAPAPNTRGVLVLAWMIPLIAVVGVVAAIKMAPQKSSFEKARDEMEQAI